MAGPPIQAKLRFALSNRLRLRSVSGSIKSLLGFSREEFLSSKIHLRDRIHPEDAGVVDSLFSPNLEKRSGAFNIRLRHADGRIRCIKGRYTKKTDRAIGEVLLDLTIQNARNVREPGDRALVTSFKTLIEHTGDYIYIQNRNHLCLAASRTVPNLTESAKDPSEVVGKTAYDVYPEEIADISYRLENQVIAEGRRVNQVLQVSAQDGSKHWIDNRKYPINGRDGEIIGIFGIAPDITDYTEAEQKLRESEESLREAQAIAGFSSYVLDIPAMVWKVSPELDALLGIDAEYDRAFEGIWPLIHPDDRAMMAERFESYFHGDQTLFDREYRIVRHTDGAVRWVHTRGMLELDAQGSPLALRGTVQDITERKLAEAALRENRELLRLFVEYAPAGLAMFDREMRYVAASRRWLEDNSLVGQEIIGRSNYEVEPNLPEDIKEWQRRAMTGEVIPPSEVCWQHAGGGQNWVREEMRPWRTGSGEIGGIIVVVEDVTERRQAEAALLESRAKLEAALASMTDAVFICDNGERLLEFNEAFARFHKFKNKAECGTTIEESRKFVELLGAGGEPEPIETRPALRALRGESGTDVEYTLRRKDTGETWIGSYSYAPIRDKDGAITGAVAIARDVTEKKRAETALHEGKELLQLFIEQAPVALAMFDREMRYLAVSRHWLRQYDLVGQEIIGRSHYEIHPHLPEHFKEAHRRGLAGETVKSDEDRYNHPDGKERWVRWQIVPWRAGDGSVGGILIFAEDITERKLEQAALRDSKELLELFIKHSPAALVMLNREMRHVAASLRWLESFSLKEEEIIGRSHYEVMPNLPEHYKEAHRRGMAGEVVRVDAEPLKMSDGTLLWSRWEVMPWRTGYGDVGGIIIFGENITQRIEAEERLRLAATVFTHASEGIAITDPSGAILEINDAFARITGYSREEALGQNPRLLRSGLQTGEFYENMWRSLIETGHWSGEIWNRAKSGNIFAEMLTINALRDAEGAVQQYVAHFSDLTELKERERELEHIAHFDALTGLPNRTLLADRLRQAMTQVRRRKQMLAVVYIDLDGFKEINDRHGRNAGDKLLTSLAFQMKCALRQGDTLARLGGDEFVAMILDLDSVEASTSTLTRLLGAAAERTQVGDYSLCVSASVGVTYYPQTEEVDADQLMRQADQAMCQAKLAGRNRFHRFDPELDITVRGRNENIDHIRHALAAGQFVLYYQPKVNMRTGAVIGAEALIRWQHPERGLLPPGMFLPVIEDHPIAIDLGEWVIDTALAQIEAWQAAGLHIPVSVNVSALQLQQPDFVDRLKALLAAHPRVKASYLELEVLETSALQDLVQTSQLLQACREMGVPVALDDFGTGYSSLTYLKRLPAGILKIDQSFVSGIAADPEDLAILEGLLGLAAAFGRQVIAEGVETVDHGLMLLQMGCELAQGYAIAQPLPAGDLPAWVSAWLPDPSWANVPPVHADNRAVLHANVEHRAWLAAFEACLEGRRADPPPLDPDQCHVGAWLKTERQSARGKLPGFQAIETLHRQFHDLAAAIYNARDGDRNVEGLACLEQLQCLQDKFLKRLTAFARNGSSRMGREGSRSRAGAAVRAGVP